MKTQSNHQPPMKRLLPFIIYRSTFNLFLLILFLLPSILFSQVPQSFNYQAVARNNNGEILKNTALDIRLTLLQGSESGMAQWTETRSVTTNNLGLFTIEAGSITPLDIDWTKGPYYLKTELDMGDGNGWKEMGTIRILSVPYALQAESVNNLKKLKIQGTDLPSDSALFEVKRKDGQTVFAVYNEGVRIYVDTSSTKGHQRGGFAIGGFGMTKGAGEEYMRVTPDSVRIYLNNTPTKRPRGGFAIGGFGSYKGTGQEYLRITEDSARLYINDQVKGPQRGGFAIGGFGSYKGTRSQYFNVSGSSAADIIHSENRVLWYPKKNAFLAGRVLVEDPDSVGTNSFSAGYEAKAMGEYSQALGYKAHAKGNNSTAIGNNAGAVGNESYAMGNFAKTTRQGAYAIGSGASAKGLRSFAIGSVGVDSAGKATSPTEATGDYAYAFGMGSNASGMGAFALGTQNGAAGDYSLAMGYNTHASNWYATTLGYDNTASGFTATSVGFRTIANGDFSTATGRETMASGYVSTAIGWMTEASELCATAMGRETTASGGIATAMGASTTASGLVSTAMGEFTTASGHLATAMGSQTIASGEYTTSMGYYTQAGGYISTAMGNHTIANGQSATAMGENTIADGAFSTTMGFDVTARGDMTVAMGYHTLARSCCSMVIGRYNDTTSTLNYWLDTDPLFVIGNGSTNENRHNAMRVNKNGEVYFPDVYSYTVEATNRSLYIDNTGKIGFLPSARRYKKNIHAMENINWIYQLKPVNFIYKTDKSGSKQYGLIAEEVEKVNPLFVSYDNRNHPETVLYEQLVSPMLKALQEHEKTIEALKKKIEKLEAEKSELAQLKKEIKELRRIMDMAQK